MGVVSVIVFRTLKGKKVIITLHAKKTYRPREGIAQFILNLGNRWRRVIYFMPRPLYPRGRTPVPTEQKAGWAPEPVWSFNI